MSVKKLSVVNSEKMERLLNALQNRNNNTEIVEKALDEPEKIGLIDSYNDMQKSVSANSMLAGLKKQQYIRKKLNYREKIKNKEKKTNENNDDGNDPGNDGVAGDADGQPIPQKTNTKAYSKARIEKFMKNNNLNVDDNTGSIKAGNVNMGINYEDFIEDITTNRTSGDNNLSNIETDRVLLKLVRKKMPASYIRSTKHKKRFLEIKATLSSSPLPVSSGSSPGTSGESSGLGSSITTQPSRFTSPPSTPKTTKQSDSNWPSWLSPKTYWKTQ